MLIAVAALVIVSIAGIGYIHFINATVAATERDDIEYLEREAPAIYDPILSSGEPPLRESP